MASLSDANGRSPIDAATVVGAALGHVAGLVVKGAREFFGKLFDPASLASPQEPFPVRDVIPIASRQSLPRPIPPERTLSAGD